ncbi:MAG: acyclic terpene utilization AtuA family protein [Sneathiella sp.]
MTKKTIRIGGASGYWGDSQEAPKQLVLNGNIDYLVFDYLAEVTMSILARIKAKNPDSGYARDFVELAMKPLLQEIKSRGIKVVANAGGVNVKACAEALSKVAEDLGISLKIGIVEGDDLSDRFDALQKENITEMFTGEPLPEKLTSANAYLGAFPIAAALDEGADIVITGRCVDSAVTLGPLIHEFGWGLNDFDQLAAGCLAGHILECGAQATGGNFTDWQDVVGGWDNMGYPIADCRADGCFSISKPDKTGGLVSPLTVGEQVLYEIGDPAAYIMPDVICDFSGVIIQQAGKDKVEISGVKGKAPTPFYKVSATYPDGYRATAMTVITGFDAPAKGQHFGEALIRRTEALFRERNFGEYRETAIHLIGAQTLWGENANDQARSAREITARIDVRHDEKDAINLFSKEATGVGLSMTTGRAPGGAAGRPKVTPVVAQFAFLIAKDRLTPTVTVDSTLHPVTAQPSTYTTDVIKSADMPAPLSPNTEMEEVPLIDLAVARSGDKGDSANIGVIARSETYLPYIGKALTATAVKNWFSHTTKGEVDRYFAPGMNAFNFLLGNTLGGGGTSSLHLDSQAKTYGQQILAMPIPVPKTLAAALSKKQGSK